ncbi:MAG TPA: MFS transporter [Candidatus Thermoplasmatota archaeon]|nr:MFS transporter [Candidatus Thermoplasmatota archaeon]
MTVPYSEDERARGQRVMILEGVFSRAMEGVTGGVVLAGFALALGASDLEIGLVAAIPFLAQLAHVPTVAYLARFPDRKTLAVGAAALARLFFFAMAMIPFLALPVRPVAALIPLLVAYATFATFSGGAWQVWVRELVPRDSIGRYFGRRMAILAAFGLLVVLGAGQFLQRWPGDPLVAFAILFAIGGTLGLVSAGVLSRAPSRASSAVPHGSFLRVLRKPFADANYRRLLVFLGAWGFAANLALPFLSVMLLRTLGFGFGVVTALAATSQLSNVLGLRLWGPITDRFGSKPVLGLAGSVFLVGMSLWAFLPKTASTGTLVLAAIVHVLLGFALAGLDVASTSVTMRLAQEQDAPAYLASASVVKALAAGIAPLLGGLLATLLAQRRFSVRLVWTDPNGEDMVNAVTFIGHEYLFLLSVILCLYALHRLLAFTEEGEAPPEQVVRAMRREVGQVSSIAGMRQFAHAASYLVEAAYRFERSLDVKRALELDKKREKKG